MVGLQSPHSCSFSTFCLNPHGNWSRVGRRLFRERNWTNRAGSCEGMGTFRARGVKVDLSLTSGRGAWGGRVGSSVWMSVHTLQDPGTAGCQGLRSEHAHFSVVVGLPWLVRVQWDSRETKLLKRGGEGWGGILKGRVIHGVLSSQVTSEHEGNDCRASTASRRSHRSRHWSGAWARDVETREEAGVAGTERAGEGGVRDEVRAGGECHADLVRLGLLGARWEATGGSGSAVSGVTEDESCLRFHC